MVWKDNTAHSVVAGILLFEHDCWIEDECSLFRNFFIYKTFHYGIYTAGVCRIEYDSIIIADTHVGILNMIGGPDIRDHEIGNKPVTIINSLFVGQSLAYDCDHLSEFDYASPMMEAAKSGHAECHEFYYEDEFPKCDGMSAIFMPTYTSKLIHPPLKKFSLPKAQIGHGSRMHITGITHSL